MTTETEAERRVPEHPGWRPEWLRVAEFDGERVVLHTWDSLAPNDPRWGICDGGAMHLNPGTWHHSLAEAEAAFEAACERLREGG